MAALFGAWLAEQLDTKPKSSLHILIPTNRFKIEICFFFTNQVYMLNSTGKNMLCRIVLHMQTHASCFHI